MKYIYPVVFSLEDKGGYCVYAPDFPGCVTQAETMLDGMEKIREGLCGMLMIFERDGRTIPTPSALSDLEKEPGDIASLVDADVDEYKRRISSKAVRRTISIPEWMDDAATTAGISLSQVTQEALRKVLAQ